MTQTVLQVLKLDPLMDLANVDGVDDAFYDRVERRINSLFFSSPDKSVIEEYLRQQVRFMSLLLRAIVSTYIPPRLHIPSYYDESEYENFSMYLANAINDFVELLVCKRYEEDDVKRKLLNCYSLRRTINYVHIYLDRHLGLA